jgi:ribosomal protein S27E
MSKEIIGNYLVLKCPYCDAEITQLMKPSLKIRLKKVKFKCPICGKEI